MRMPGEVGARRQQELRLDLGTHLKQGQVAEVRAEAGDAGDEHHRTSRSVREARAAGTVNPVHTGAEENDEAYGNSDEEEGHAECSMGRGATDVF